jgi:hypothetical protein
MSRESVGGRDELDAQADTVPSLGFEPRLPALGVQSGGSFDMSFWELTCADVFQGLPSAGGALSVLSANGRLILANGSHRAYALMAAGITHVPAIVQHIVREDDLEVAPLAKQNTAFYLKDPRPSLLRDYFTEGLYDVVDRMRRARQLRLQFGYESADVPG